MAKLKAGSPAAARFTRLRLESWKNFKPVDVELAGRVFVIGANASGKSNLLDAFRFLHDLATEGGGLVKAVALREGMPKVRSLHATGKSAVRIGVDAVGTDGRRWAYDLAFDTPHSAGTDVEVTEEVVRCDEKAVLARPDGADKSDPERRRQTAVEQVSANRDFRPLVELFRSVQFMNLVPQLIREGQVSPGVFPGADPLGRDLLEQVRRAPKGERTKRLRAIGVALKRAVPGFADLRLEVDGRGRPHLAVGFRHWRKNAAKQLESQFSDGTLRLIAMLWSLQEAAGPLLLEEPEWSLHTGIIERLGPLIARMQEEGGGRQVVVSTHSEKLLGDKGIAAEELLLVLPATKGGSEVKAGPRLSVVAKAMKSGLSAAEAAQPLTRLKTMPLFGIGA